MLTQFYWICFFLVTFFVIGCVLTYKKNYPKKIPYKKLFRREKKEYIVKKDSFIYSMVVLFFFSIGSIGFLIRITLISLPFLLFILILIGVANLFVLKKKYKINDITDRIFVAVVIGLGQLSMLLWLNFIPTGKHAEAYQIVKYEKDEWAQITTLHLKDEALSEYWNIRTFESANAPFGDTVIYHFKEGLIGFRIYDGHASH